jgi:hypothetical protein
MARIRTIKPEFYRNRRVWRAEQETGLPLRVAYPALWTCADREGRFKWEPEELKLDCLPYDDLDFSRVLDALAARGFIVRYEVGGDTFGWIPGFRRHQVINNRETASSLPEPPKIDNRSKDIPARDARDDDASATREPRATDLHERKGREGKGTGKEGEGKGTLELALGDASTVQEAFGLWNVLAQEIGLPSARLLTDKRERALRQRLAEAGGIDGWKAALEKVRASTFLCGGGGRPWRATLDFLLQQTSFARVLEGAYDDRGRPGEGSWLDQLRADVVAQGGLEVIEGEAA